MAREDDQSSYNRRGFDPHRGGEEIAVSQELVPGHGYRSAGPIDANPLELTGTGPGFPEESDSVFPTPSGGVHGVAECRNSSHGTGSNPCEGKHLWYA